MADDVEWDPRKAAANLKKHGVDFADAATVLYDDRVSARQATPQEREHYEAKP
jgi:uncharacterized DUF497 family protein